MGRMISLSPERRAEMERRGQEKVEREFDEKTGVSKYLEAIAANTAKLSHSPGLIKI